MNNIFTLTLNPALDNNTRTERIYPDGKLRCDRPDYEPGGGGINVSRAIRKLGGESVAIFTTGGPSGDRLNQLMHEEGVKTQTFQVADWTRENLNITETTTEQQYRFVMPGASMTEEELDQVLKYLKQVKALDMLVISGSLPLDVPSDFYAKLLRHCKSHGIRCIVDTSGDPLAHVVKEGGCTLIKPNAKELRNLTGIDADTPAHLETAALALVEEGKAESVLVSLGPQGALLVWDNGLHYITPPAVKKMSTVGAGDSMVGAVVYKLSQGESLLTAAQYGVAAGTAATMRFGSELCSLKDTEELFDWILHSGSTHASAFER